MKFFLRTGFGDSKEYAGSTDGKKTQGLCQGNGAAPAGWTATSVAILQAHRRKGHGVNFRAQFPGGQSTWQEPFLLTIRTLNTIK